MKMHELIDRFDPVCLYCGTRCITTLEGTRLQTGEIEDHDILQCQKCREIFRVESIQNPEGETRYTGFQFTCNKLRIIYKYDEEKFRISDLNDRNKEPIVIPTFEVDFSDKKKLHEKLKTYILFS
jgi:hypothetical protein